MFLGCMPIYFNKRYYQKSYDANFMDLCDHFANESLKIIIEKKPDILFLNFL